MKRIIIVLLSCALLFCGFQNVSAEEKSTDMVVFISALFDTIEYDKEWFDINSDGNVDIIDLVYLKKNVAGIKQSNYKPIKSITITYNYTNRTETVKQYTSKCTLPSLSVGYWKNGTTYYNPNSIINLYNDTIFSYSENKSIDTPIIPI